MGKEKPDMYDAETYYRIRNQFDNSLLGRMSHRQRLFIHPFLWHALKFHNRISGIKTSLLYDRSTGTDRPKIFAITHIGKYDIEACTSVLKDHYYLLSGDFEHIHGSSDEMILGVNGVVYVKKDDREDRRLSKEKMIGVLKMGGNLMYFPEGAWNLSENLPLLQCPYGIIDVAMRGGAEIIPVGIEQYGKQFFIAIGENFSAEHYAQDDLLPAISELRDVMAKLKWDIWAHASQNPAIMTPDKEEFSNQIRNKLKEWTASADFFERAKFKPKTVVNEREVYSFLPHMPIHLNNVFLAKTKRQYIDLYSTDNL